MIYDFRFKNLKPKTYNLKPNKGFTLIELLVVIGIIGLLSTVVFATLSGTRPRARDARRLSEVRQLELILTVEDTAGFTSTSLTVCSSSANARVSSCTGPNTVADFGSFNDPSTGTGGSPCVSGASVACDYSISTSAGAAGATTGNYRICFWIEDPASAGLSGTSAGVYQVKSTSRNITSNCN